MNREEKRLLSEATMDMTDLLVSYGFSPENAISEATKFWNRHKKKLREAGLW